MTHHHRASALKQQNKLHKTGRHRSNRSLDNTNRGRVQLKLGANRRPSTELRRHERRQQLRQLRDNKRQLSVDRKRSLGTASAPPLLLALVPLSRTVSVQEALKLVAAADGDLNTVTTSPQHITHVSVSRLKRRVALVAPPGGDLHATLDAVKLADTVVFLMDVDGPDECGCTLLSAVFAHGVVSTATVLLGTASLTPKRLGECRKRLGRQLSRWWGSECRLHTLNIPADVPPLLHQLVSVRRRMVTYRHRRPHLLAERVQFTPSTDQAGSGTLSVSGYLRSRPLSANQLVHVCGWGDYQLSHISAPADPHPLAVRAQSAGAVHEMTDVEETVICRADPAQRVSLDCENVPEDVEMDADGDEDRLRDAETFNRIARRVRVPAGMSDYQASWIVDSDAEVSDDDVDTDGMSCDGDLAVAPPAADDSDADSNQSAVEEEEGAASEADEDRYDAQMNLEEEEQTLNQLQDAREDEMFPDELDTPRDRPARLRFNKYRGLASFRSSAWDPRENLPLEYARCFQFANMQRTRRLALAERAEDAAQPGRYVTLHIIDVPSHLYWDWRGAVDSPTVSSPRPLALFGLLAHEHRMSVLNCVLHRQQQQLQQPVPSKSRLQFHVGFRRFSAAPVFSQHTNGDKHKMERFFRADSTVVATMYAPIMYGPAPVLALQENKDGGQDLIATGTMLSVNPDRLITKRAVLSGHPFKINKRSAVVRYMFFNRDDILWFKPVELRTKNGRRGNIKESLGTHGHMKVVFNGPISSQDSVLLTLYKRVFPKWTYDPHVSAPPALYSPGAERLSALQEEPLETE